MAGRWPAVAAVGRRGRAFRALDHDFALAFIASGAFDRFGEAGRERARNGEARLIGRYADRAHLVAGDVAAAAQ